MRPKIQDYLREDVGSGDITTDLVIPKELRAEGRIVVKEKCVLAGCDEACDVFRELGAVPAPAMRDGEAISKDTVVLTVEGSAGSILTGERLALNFLMRMSGIATVTNEMVRKCRKINPLVKVAATRKTTPGFREFEKKAVVLGNGDPHRFSLADAVLIKDNHIKLAGGIAQALESARSSSFTKKIEVEVESEEDAMVAVRAGADIIMLDNFPPSKARRLHVRLKRERPEVVVEISGGIRPDNIERYADAADVISVGWITHSARSIDFSMSIDRS